MPYIKGIDRNLSTNLSPRNPGELNYAITFLINTYLRTKGINYQHINDIIGALEGAKLEFYRRIASYYEDRKMMENGDVYDSNYLPPEAIVKHE